MNSRVTYYDLFGMVFEENLKSVGIEYEYHDGNLVFPQTVFDNGRKESNLLEMLYSLTLSQEDIREVYQNSELRMTRFGTNIIYKIKDYLERNAKPFTPVMVMLEESNPFSIRIIHDLKDRDGINSAVSKLSLSFKTMKINGNAHCCNVTIENHDQAIRFLQQIGFKVTAKSLKDYSKADRKQEVPLSSSSIMGLQQSQSARTVEYKSIVLARKQEALQALIKAAYRDCEASAQNIIAMFTEKMATPFFLIQPEIEPGEDHLGGRHGFIIEDMGKFVKRLAEMTKEEEGQTNLIVKNFGKDLLHIIINEIQQKQLGAAVAQNNSNGITYQKMV